MGTTGYVVSEEGGGRPGGRASGRDELGAVGIIGRITWIHGGGATRIMRSPVLGHVSNACCRLELHQMPCSCPIAAVASTQMQFGGRGGGAGPCTCWHMICRAVLHYAMLVLCCAVRCGTFCAG